MKFLNFQNCLDVHLPGDGNCPQQHPKQGTSLMAEVRQRMMGAHIHLAEAVWWFSLDKLQRDVLFLCCRRKHRLAAVGENGEDQEDSCNFYKGMS